MKEHGSDTGRPDERGDENGMSEDAWSNRRCRFCGLLLSTEQMRRGHEMVCQNAPGSASSKGEEENDFLSSLMFFIKIPYAQNPFYLISALLVLYGLNVAFGTSAEQANPWTLLGVLAGYTSLMALSAVIIVRAGEVWADVRSILVVLVLLFLGISVSFDEILALMPFRGSLLMLTGLGFSLAISWALLKILRIRLPRLYLLPGAAILALFFCYPIGLPILEKAVGASGHDLVGWGIYLFPTIAGILFLSLIPAIRRGKEYVEDNGTPWGWPWFPWVLFGLLAGAVVARSYMLGLSFYPAWLRGSPFQTFFLVPFLLCLGVLLVELAVVSRLRLLGRIGLVLPVIAQLLCLAAVPHGKVQTHFIQTYMAAAGPPLLLGALLSMMFYVYAWIRGTRWAEAGVVLSLLVLSITGHEILGSGTVVIPRALPLIAIAILQGWQAMRHRSSVRASVSTVVLVGAITLAARGSWFTMGMGVIPVHFTLLCLLGIGALFHDRFARLLRKAGPFILVALLGTVLSVGFALNISAGGILLYAALMMAVQLGYAWWTRMRTYVISLMISLPATLLYVSGSVIRALTQKGIPKGTWFLIWGGLFFVVALFISCMKAGLIQHATHLAVRRLFGEPCRDV